MKTKLSFKILAAFILMCCLVVALIAGSYRYVVVRNFWRFVAQTALSHLDDFSSALVSEYETHQGWRHLAEDRERWFALMAVALPQKNPDRLPPFAGEKRSSSADGEPSGDAVAASGAGKEKSPVEPPRRHSRRLTRSLALFDEHRAHVIGGLADAGAEKYELRALKSGGRTIGWLGLLKREYFSDPIVIAFRKEQTRTFVYIGLIILALAALVSLLLSRHLLAPIRQLAQGTRALTTFQFDTRIQVDSQDELGQLAEDFNRMAARLKQYEWLRRQWISDISHELRTPLAILKGEIEAMQDGVRPLERAQLDSLHAEVLRLGKLVDDLHDLSLADSQNLLLRKEPIRPLTLLSKMVDHYTERMHRSQLEVELSLGEDTRLVMEGDADRIQQLFANLLENSLLYTDPPGQLKIGARYHSGQLTIRFEDSPPGVPDEVLDRIFERLYRVDSSRSRNLGGSGLGLAICRQIVEAHGGTIGSAQTPVGGLMITLTLPVKKGGVAT